MIVILLVVWLGSRHSTTWENSSGETARAAATGDPGFVGGADHCGWGSAEFLFYGGEQYLFDAGDGKVLEDAAAAGFDISVDPHSSLPDDAVNTGWHEGDLALWIAPSEESAGGYRNIYVVSSDEVRRLPRYPLGCQ